MKRTRIFKRAGGILAAVVVASSALVAGASAHSVDKAQTLTFPIVKTPGGEVTILGQKVFLPRNMTGEAVLTYDVKGQTSDLIVSEAAADDCTPPQAPFIGVDIISAGGNLTAQLQVTGTAVGADGQEEPYDSGLVGGSQSLGNPGQKTDVMSICLDLS